MHQVIKKGDQVRVREIDAGVKNKFNWSWLDEKEVVKGITVTLGDHVVKVDLPGKAWCQLCSASITYGGRGKKTIINHVTSEKHMKKLKSSLSTYVFPASFRVPSQSQSQSQPSEVPVPRTIGIRDRTTHMQVRYEYYNLNLSSLFVLCVC